MSRAQKQSSISGKKAAAPARFRFVMQSESRDRSSRASAAFKGRGRRFIFRFPALLLTAFAASCFVSSGAPAPQPAAPAKSGAVSTNTPAPVNRQLGEDEVRGLLAAYLDENRGEGGAKWELHFTRPWDPITVPNKPLSVKILEPSLSRIYSSCIFRFELRAGGKLLGSWQAPARVQLWRDVLVTHGNLRRGDPLNSTEVASESRDVLTLRNPVFDLPEDPGAYEIAESLQDGMPLTPRSFRLRPVVFRGQTADAVVKQGAMVISLKVEVMENGVPGQLVRVRNLVSRRELRGKVRDAQTISITL